MFSFKAKIDGERCLFEHSEHVGSCEGSGKLIAITDVRLNNIIEKSKLGNDLLHVDLEKCRSQNVDHIIQFNYHKNCVPTYISNDHIKRTPSSKEGPQYSSNETPVKRKRRSEIHVFDWRQHCLFCGAICSVEADPKHPDRWREAYESHTSERPGRPTFKNTILSVS